MRKFKFNLQRVLDYRESIEEKLLMELASGSVSDGYFLPWTKLHEKLAILES